MQAEKRDIRDIAHERWLDFTQTLGEDGFFEDDIIASMRHMAEICSTYFGDDATAIGFTQIVRGAFPYRKEHESWEQILDQEFGSIFSDSAIGQLLHDLTAYADYGIVLATTRDSVQREQLLEGQIKKAQRLLELLPLQQWGLADERLTHVIAKASARWKVDNGQTLDAVELSVLSGRALQTIKNKLSGKYKEIQGTQKRIEGSEALAWLAAQKDFMMSIWREQDDPKAVEAFDTGLGQVFFLPVAKDGSVFHPGVKRDGKYLIDEDGRERALEDFDEALQALQSMLFPQWRRPTKEGQWTRVRGIEWRRYSQDELDDMTSG